MRSDQAIKLWEGETQELFSGATLIRVGGHFPGGTVLYWSAGADGKGALLPGDNVQVVSDNKSVSFMWSYPNLIPLSAPSIEGVVRALKPYQFDPSARRLYRSDDLESRQSSCRAVSRTLPADDSG